MKWWLFAFMGWSSLAWAGPYFSTGYEYRPEQNTESYFQDRTLAPFAIGWHQNSFVYMFERGEHTEQSGNAALNMSRKYQNNLLGFIYMPEIGNPYLRPYLGVSAGMYQEKITTQFGEAGSTDSSRQKWMLMQNFGLSLMSSSIFFAVEARLFETENGNPRYFLGTVARIGVLF